MAEVRAVGQMPDGRAVLEYTLDNGRGLTLSAINLGGIVTALRCPDREGRGANVVLGFDNLDDYVQRNPNFGTLFGVLILGIVQTLIAFDGSLSSWWTRIVIGALLFVFCLLQRGFESRRGGH